MQTILFTVQVKTILFIYTIPYNWRRFGLYHTTEDDYITLLIAPNRYTLQVKTLIQYNWRLFILYCYFRVLSLYPTTEDDLQYKWRLIHMLITNLVVYYTTEDDLVIYSTTEDCYFRVNLNNWPSRILTVSPVPQYHLNPISPDPWTLDLNCLSICLPFFPYYRSMYLLCKISILVPYFYHTTRIGNKMK